jgi:general stress protein CsbA
MLDANPPADDDDDYELELEPIDAEILEHQRQRAAQRTESTATRADVDELYGDAGPYSDLELDLTQLKQFRFTTRHLFIATALLAILLTIFRLNTATNAIVVIAAVLLAAGWVFTLRLERKQEAERARRRDEFFGEPAEADALTAAEAVEAPPRPEFRFAFSIKEMLITTAVAAVALALLLWIGPRTLSVGLGLIALAGIAANAIGYDPPRHVVLGWWILLVMYLLVGLFAIVAPDENVAAQRRHDHAAPQVFLADVPGAYGGATA